MKRQIKFRAWTGKEYVYGQPITNKLGIWMCGENPHCCDEYGYIETENLTKVLLIEQFTGLTDKIGNIHENPELL